jgi:hypothetical protein
MANIKNRFISFFYILLVLSAVAGFAGAQESRSTAPAAAPTGIFDPKTFNESLPELGLLPEGEMYISRQGGFTISLPVKPLFIFAPHGQKYDKYKFIWLFKECSISVDYHDLRAVDADEEFEKMVADFKEGANVTSITPVTLGEYRGHEAVLDMQDSSKGLSRIFRVGNRVYWVSGFADDSPPYTLTLVRQVIDTFEVG